MDTFEKLHNWIYFKYAISVTKKTMILVILLFCSILFLVGSLVYNSNFNMQSAVSISAPLPPIDAPSASIQP